MLYGRGPSRGPEAPPLGARQRTTGRAVTLAGDRAGYRRGLVLIVLASLLWSTGGVVTRLLHSDDWTTIFWRSVFATVLLGLWLLARGPARALRSLRALGGAGLLAAALLGVDQMLFVAALNRTSVAHVAIILAAAPLCGALFGWLMLGEPVRLRTWVAMGTAGAGIVFMVAGDDSGGTLLGDLMALGLPVSFTLAVVILNRRREIELIPVVAVASFMVVLGSAPFVTPSLPDTRELALLAWFGGCEHAGGTLLFTAGARYVPAAQAMLLALVETVLAPIWAWLVVTEAPGARALIGGALVLAAVTGLALRELRPAPMVPVREGGGGPPG